MRESLFRKTCRIEWYVSDARFEEFHGTAFVGGANETHVYAAALYFSSCCCR